MNLAGRGEFTVALFSVHSRHGTALVNEGDAEAPCRQGIYGINRPKIDRIVEGPRETLVAGAADRQRDEVVGLLTVLLPCATEVLADLLFVLRAAVVDDVVA